MKTKKENNNKQTIGEIVAYSYSPFINPRDITEKLRESIDNRVNPLLDLLERCESSFVNLIAEGRTAFQPKRNEIRKILNDYYRKD